MRHTANLFDLREIAALVETVRPTHVLHLAWVTTPGDFWQSHENLNWVAASLNLLQAFAQAGGRRAVFAGTCAEYDWTTGSGLCCEQTTPLNPRGLYGECKNAVRAIAERYAQQTVVSFALGRIFSPYGPGEHAKKLVASAIRSMLAGEPTDCTSGAQVRDYLYVEDAAEAFVQLLLSDFCGSINIASGEPIQVAALVRTIGQIVGRSDLVRLGNRPPNADEPPFLVADVKRLRNEIGWRPSYDLPSGLSRTVDSYKEGRSAELNA